MTALIVVLASTASLAVGVCIGRHRAAATRYRLALARDVILKHEALMASAVPHVRNLATVADKAGLHEDAVRLRSLANQLSFATGIGVKFGRV